MLNDPLANVMSAILNNEKVGKKTVAIKPTSNVIKKVLTIMKDLQLVGEFEEVDDGRGSHLKLNLLGNINNCGAIKPRYAVKLEDFVKFEKRYLPALGFGIIIVSTSKGIMTLEEAKKQKVGGKLLVYCY
ncbi:30S ribosomal protein S8 [Candidatus Woesearchaeota archaeon CG11_big_fil_rev_8_21_14_0_20_43_8]|nr:MAG: 30S ribosomal protein S8 [Candidatus Woesearchaeota archaeon CG11_big_fil_rev_8_21_14_0_20_43_8]PIO08939.1 MAG: 30S ribosomal protein S8 [Candidatus Woesearchaeota archaeon CG08_land_8_20_14_0_20_43_7]